MLNTFLSENTQVWRIVYYCRPGRSNTIRNLPSGWTIWNDTLRIFIMHSTQITHDRSECFVRTILMINNHDRNDVLSMQRNNAYWCDLTEEFCFAPRYLGKCCETRIFKFPKQSPYFQWTSNSEMKIARQLVLLIFIHINIVGIKTTSWSLRAGDSTYFKGI